MKRFYQYSLFLCIAFLGLTSCVKDDIGKSCSDHCVVISGKITSENNSLVPVSDVEYEFNYYGPPTGIGGGALRRKIAKGKTDANGYYELRFSPEDEEIQEGSYRFKYRKSGYWSAESNVEESYNSIHYSGIVKKDTLITTNIHLPVENMLKVHIKNFIPATSQDNIMFVNCGFSLFNNPTLPSMIQSVQAIYPQNGSDQNIVLKGAGNQYNIISFQGYRHGAVFEKKDTVFLEKGKVSEYEFTY